MAEAKSGRLIAIDGAQGNDVADAAAGVYDRLTDGGTTAGVSRWDASGLFSDVVSAPAVERDVSPRTLVLLYAADLAFRLRWEIGPSLEQGLVVVAAPYVTTAMSFGLATGLSNEWLSALFRFAPVPARTVVLRGRKWNRTWKRKPERGFAECCATLLGDTPEGFSRKKTRAAMVKALSEAAETHGRRFRGRDLRALAADLTAKRERR